MKRDISERKPLRVLEDARKHANKELNDLWKSRKWGTHEWMYHPEYLEAQVRDAIFSAAERQLRFEAGQKLYGTVEGVKEAEAAAWARKAQMDVLRAKWLAKGSPESSGLVIELGVDLDKGEITMQQRNVPLRDARQTASPPRLALSDYRYRVDAQPAAGNWAPYTSRWNLTDYASARSAFEELTQQGTRAHLVEVKDGKETIIEENKPQV